MAKTFWTPSILLYIYTFSVHKSDPRPQNRNHLRSLLWMLGEAIYI